MVARSVVDLDTWTAGNLAVMKVSALVGCSVDKKVAL